jgi:hypothetical protein
MNHDVDSVIRHLLALTGADPRKAKLPLGKRKVRVHTQRIGDVRLITVAPMRGHCPKWTPPYSTTCVPRPARCCCVASSLPHPVR